MKIQEKIKYTSLFFAVIGLIAAITGCKKNGEKIDSDLRVEFQLQDDGENYNLEEVFRISGSTDIFVDKFQFYVSDFAMTNSDGETRDIKEISLFSFESNGKATLDFEMPKGIYENISFGVGVKKTLNEGDPANYNEEGHPLNTIENNYWGWATMYRFITIEGRYDSDLDGTFEGTFAYHTGLEDSYRNFSLDHEMRVKKNDENILAFKIDVEQILGAAGNALDVAAEPYYHGGMENFHLSEKISDNLLNAIVISE